MEGPRAPNPENRAFMEFWRPQNCGICPSVEVEHVDFIDSPVRGNLNPAAALRLSARAPNPENRAFMEFWRPQNCSDLAELIDYIDSPELANLS